MQPMPLPMRRIFEREAEVAEAARVVVERGARRPCGAGRSACGADGAVVHGRYIAIGEVPARPIADGQTQGSLAPCKQIVPGGSASARA